jgi:SAM-dependent methyltransferase
MSELPFSQACANNQQYIAEALQSLLPDARLVLEVGSGTGQHAVYFAPRLPHLRWQPSDMAENLSGIEAWLAAEPSDNLLPPLQYDIRVDAWPDNEADAVFSANAVHIMHWETVEQLFAHIGASKATTLCLYGPFNYKGQFTSDSNARFDQWLKARDPGSGIRDFEALDALAARDGFELAADLEMPANNRILCWRR